MTHVSLEHFQPELTEAEHASFEAIVERFNVPLDAELVEDANACLYLNERINATDLQADRIAELKQTRDELLAEFLEHPQSAFMAEVLNYARLCKDRSLVWQDTLGTTVTEFVTSDHERGRADMQFSILQFTSGVVKVRAEVPLRGDLFESEEPFFISADTEGRFEITQRVWRRGQYQYQPLSLEPGEAGEDRLKRFFMFSTEAVHLAYTRNPDERAAIDQQAKRYLLEKKRGYDPR
ncbi:MAG TPA: hypothetical protein VLF16_02850 [Pseudomonas sp.]|nr:hypothetical protein [Pseudomonas sp.]